MLLAIECNDMDCPDMYTTGRHYHCGSCNGVTGYQGHFLGGNREDARIICDPQERQAYLRSIGL